MGRGGRGVGGHGLFKDRALRCEEVEVGCQVVPVSTGADMVATQSVEGDQKDILRFCRCRRPIGQKRGPDQGCGKAALRAWPRFGFKDERGWLPGKGCQQDGVSLPLGGLFIVDDFLE